MHAIMADYNGNSNIGLFCYATDKYCLVPRGFPEKMIKEFSETLQVPVHTINAAGTSLLGVFFNGTDEILLVPPIMFKSELKDLEEYGIKFKVINTELTALGNNLLINENVCIASSEYDKKALKEIEKALGIPVKLGKIEELDTVGSLAVINKKGCVISPDAKEFEIKFLEKNLGVPVTTGTVNFGSNYVHSGVLCNTKGFVIGEQSGGPEIQNIDIGLGFLED